MPVPPMIMPSAASTVAFVVIVAAVVGMLVLATARAGRRRGPSRPLVWAFNLLGTALLVNVATIAVLSSPVPFRYFTKEPAVLLAFHFPYGWIVPFCVGAALAGHVIVFGWLARPSA